MVTTTENHHHHHVSASSMEQPGLGPKKTLFVMVTVVGCIAILWPKVFYPMMFGASQTNNNKPLIKDHRMGPVLGCCDVVLDQQKFSNLTDVLFQPGYRKRQLNLFTGEMSLRQERPPQLRPDGIHPAMRERGRAIPTAATVPIIDKPPSAVPSVPRIVEGRPGPIPGMRPPMGAGSVHQVNPKGAGSMGFIMPLYTIGIVAFFIYTIMKLIFKKNPNEPSYAEPIKSNPEFVKQVFGQEVTNGVSRKSDGNIANIGWTNNGTNNGTVSLTGSGHEYAHPSENGTSSNNGHLISSSSLSDPYGMSLQRHGESDLEFQLRETEQLLEISLLKKKLRETEMAMSNIIAKMGTVPKAQGLIDAADEQLSKRDSKSMDLSKETSIPETNGAILLNAIAQHQQQQQSNGISNGHAKQLIPDEVASAVEVIDDEEEAKEKKIEAKKCIGDFIKKQQSLDKSGAKKSSTPKSPPIRDTSNDRSIKVLGMEMTASCEGGKRFGRPPTPKSHAVEQQPSVPASIYLEGSLPHESQILVADSETKTEEIIDDEYEGTENEPAVVLSSKMTLSLISMDSLEKKTPATTVANKEEDDEEEDVEEEEEEEEEEDDEVEEEEEGDEEVIVSEEEEEEEEDVSGEEEEDEEEEEDSKDVANIKAVNGSVKKK